VPAPMFCPQFKSRPGVHFLRLRRALGMCRTLCNGGPLRRIRTRSAAAASSPGDRSIQTPMIRQPGSFLNDRLAQYKATKTNIERKLAAS